MAKPRGIRICGHCSSGFDALRARDARGRYCSPACLRDARAARSARGGLVIAEADVILPLPATVCLGSPDIIVAVGGLGSPETEAPANVA